MRLRRPFFITFLLVALIVSLSGCTGQTDTLSFASDSMLPDFLNDAPPKVREAYRFAVANPHELEKYPCFCGCGKMGHKSNLNCYIRDIDKAGNVTFDNHAAGCGICVDITQDVMRLMREGRSSKEIRTYVDAQYGAFGPSTDTPLPTD
jgi:hypothetical protein